MPAKGSDRTLDQLIKALNARKPISFAYEKAGTQETRTGHVYAIFRQSSGLNSAPIYVHILQTSGKSDSKDKNQFPSFRTFRLEKISGVRIHFEMDNYLTDHPTYNTRWEGYKSALAKV